MKFFHISDLHIGKKVCGFSMLEDQQFILEQIADLAQEHQPDGIWIAGDLYDKSMPSAEAVELADEFLYRFAKMQIPVWLISGNHDSASRIAYGGRMMEQAGIFVSQIFDGTMQKYTVGEGKQVDIYLLPFVRPAQVRRFYPECTIETTQQAVETILQHTQLDQEHWNVLLMHQFLAGAAVCESEEVSVGGSDQIDAAVVKEFDYVALGHLHGPQKVGRETVRYCGSPLKYSFSEVHHHKAVTVVELAEDGEALPTYENASAGNLIYESENGIRISSLPLLPRHDMREIRGPIEELLKPEIAGLEAEWLQSTAASPEADPLQDRDTNAAEHTDDRTASNYRYDYLHVTLTDQKEILDAIGRLRDVYPNVMRLDFDAEGRQMQESETVTLEEKSPMELFAEFFQRQNGFELSEEQRELAEQLWRKQEGGEQA